MLSRAGLALVSFAASVVGGLGLGAYTTGGALHVKQPVDVMAEAAARATPEAIAAEPIPQPPIQHVCSGCDAGLYKERYLQARYAIYVDDPPATELDDALSPADAIEADGDTAPTESSGPAEDVRPPMRPSGVALSDQGDERPVLPPT